MRGIYLLAATIAAGLLGLFAAANAHSTGGYIVGLGLAVACSLFGFQIIRMIVDGTSATHLLPDKPGTGWAAIIVLGVLGLVGLFVASGGDGSHYWTGLSISLACLFMIGLIMKRIFDHHDTIGRHPVGLS